MIRSVVWAAVLAVGLGTAASAAPPHVSAERMSEITRVLASDEFQGRAPGSTGEAKTIPYLIERFKAAGLEPAGENGGWTQTVPMIRTQLKTPVSVSVDQAVHSVASVVSPYRAVSGVAKGCVEDIVHSEDQEPPLCLQRCLITGAPGISYFFWRRRSAALSLFADANAAAQRVCQQ